MKTTVLRAVWLSISLLVVATASAVDPSSTTQPGRNNDELLKRLNDENPDVVREALDDLDYAGRKRMLSVKSRLIELANSPQEKLQRSAIGLLADIGPDAADAMPVLLRHLANESPEVRLSAADAVWRIGDRADLAAPVFIEVLEKDANTEDAGLDRWLRDSAARDLQTMGPAAAVSLESLLDLMDDPRAGVRSRTASILGAMGPQYRKEVEELLVAALDDPSGRVRLAAAVGLNQIDAPLESALKTLVELATQENPPSDQTANAVFAESFLASAAVEALGELENEAAPTVPVLSQLLSSHVLAVRLESATALGRIGPAAKDAIPALSTALQETETHSMPFAHRSWCVSENAAIALGRIGRDAVPVLLAALENEDVVIRARAAKALGGIPAGAEQSVGPLSRLLEDTHPFVRIEAAKALGELGPAAGEAAPQLVRLLLNERSVTSFRAGTGLGHNESTAEEAWRALLRVKPRAEQVVPPLVEALQNADRISYEAICALRQFPGEAALAREPLERLLKQKETRVAAACALAFVDPNHKEIQPILQEALFADEAPGMYAPLGLGQLTVTGRTFDADFRNRLITLAEKHYDVLLWNCVFRMLPDDERVTESFVKAVQNGHSIFDVVGLSESEITVLELIDSHPRLRQTVLRELEFVAEYDEEESEYRRQSYQLRRRIWAAEMLIRAGIELERAVACFSELVEDGDLSNHTVADTLSEIPSPPREAIPVLTKLLEDHSFYIVRGDFYGNGGERRVVGDRAALALIKLQATDALLKQLDSKDVEVRTRVVRALGQMQDESVIDDLRPLVEAPSHQVRSATMTALGRIGQAHPGVRDRLEGILKTAANDHRRSVRDAAAQALAAWRVDE